MSRSLLNRSNSSVSLDELLLKEDSPEVPRRERRRSLSPVRPVAEPLTKVIEWNPTRKYGFFRTLKRGFYERFLPSGRLSRASLEERLQDAVALTKSVLVDYRPQTTNKQYWAYEEPGLLRDREELGQPAPATVYRFNATTWFTDMVLEGHQDVFPCYESPLHRLVSVKVYTDKERQHLVRFTHHDLDIDPHSVPTTTTSGPGPAEPEDPLRHIYVYMTRETQDRLLVDLATHRVISPRPVQRGASGLTLAAVPYFHRVIQLGRAIAATLPGGANDRKWDKRMGQKVPLKVAEVMAEAHKE